MDGVQLFTLLTSPNNAQRQEAEAQYNNILTTNPDAFVQVHLDGLANPNEQFRLTVCTMLFSALRIKENQPLLLQRLSPVVANSLCAKLLAIASAEQSMKVIKMLAEVVTNVLVQLKRLHNPIEPYWAESIKFCQSTTELHIVFGVTVVSTILILLDDQTQLTACQQTLVLLQSLLKLDLVEAIVVTLDLFLSVAILLEEQQNAALNKTLLDLMPFIIQECGKLLASPNEDTIQKALGSLSEFAILPKALLQPYILYFVKGLLSVASMTGQSMRTRIDALSVILELGRPFKLLFKRQTEVVTTVLTYAFEWYVAVSNDITEWLADENNDDQESVEELIGNCADLFGGEVMYTFVLSRQRTTWKHVHAMVQWVYLSLSGGKHFYKKHVDKLVELGTSLASYQNPCVRNDIFLLLSSLVNTFPKRLRGHAQTLMMCSRHGFTDESPKVQANACNLVGSIIDMELVTADELKGDALALIQSFVALINSNKSPFDLITAAFASLNFLLHYLSNKLDAIFPTLLAFFKDNAAAVNTTLGQNPTNEKGHQQLIKIKSRLIEGLSILVYAAPSCITPPVAMEIFNEVYGVLNLTGPDRDILLPYAEKAFTRLAGVMHEAMAPYLQTIVPVVLERALQKPQIVLEKEDEKLDAEDWATTKYLGLSVGIKTSLLEEKADALATLDLFIDDLGELMFPFFPSLETTFDLVNDIFDEAIRMKATTLIHTMLTMQLTHLKKVQPQTAVAQLKASTTWKKGFPLLVESLKKETDNTVARHKIDRLESVLKRIGPNMLTLEELKLVMDMLAVIIRAFTATEKKKTREVVDGITDEELEMIRHTDDEDSKIVLHAELFFQVLVENFADFFTLFPQILQEPVNVLFMSDNPELLSVGVLFVKDLVVYAKRVEFASVLIPKLIQGAGASDADLQYNSLFSLSEVIQVVSGDALKPFINNILAMFKTVEALRGTEKNDIYEVSLLCQGSLLIYQEALSMLCGFDVRSTLVSWFGVVVNLQTVKADALVYVVEAVKKGVLAINTPELLMFYVNFIGQVLGEDEEIDDVDPDIITNIRVIFQSFKATFPENVFNDIWQRLDVSVKQVVFDLFNKTA